MVDIDIKKAWNGLCCYTRKTIYLSEPFVLINPAKEIERVGLHEIAHAMVGPNQGHNQKWKLQALAIGLTNPTACNRTAVAIPGPLMATCKGCQRVYYRERLPKHRHHCRICGRVRGGDLEWMPNPNYVNLTQILKSI
jgi:predicted SprT family Zn-dependent metalloprotease